MDIEKMANDIRFFELNTEAKIPSVGLGTWQADPGVVGDAVALSIKIHWPVRMKKGSVDLKYENRVQPDIPSTWKAMEALYDSGKAQAIGVSNFSSKKLGDLLEVARVPPAVNQVECHPSWQQDKQIQRCPPLWIFTFGFPYLA